MENENNVMLSSVALSLIELLLYVQHKIAANIFTAKVRIIKKL